LTSVRVCNKCKKELPISDFYPPPSGTRYSCKRWEYEYSVTYRKTHPGFQIRRDREYARRNPKRRWATACLSGHRRRGFKIEITCQELYQIASRTDSCFICGTPLDWQLGNKGNMKRDSPTLDRADNENVIRKDNILILCYKCNATKRDRTLQEFIDYCEAVVKRFHSHLEYPQLVHL
jgi:hypothetical protein